MIRDVGRRLTEVRVTLWQRSPQRGWVFVFPRSWWPQTWDGSVRPERTHSGFARGCSRRTCHVRVRQFIRL